MSLQASTTALKIAADILIIFGLMFFLALFTPLSGAVNALLNLALLTFDGSVNILAAETRLLMAISGGICVGWGAMIYMITTQVYASNPEVGGRIILVSSVAWFLVDSIGSVIAGAAFNAVLNIGFLIMFVAPVLLYRPQKSAQLV